MRLSDGREGVRRSAFRPRRIDSKHPDDSLRRGELEPTGWWAVGSRMGEEEASSPVATTPRLPVRPCFDGPHAIRRNAEGPRKLPALTAPQALLRPAFRSAL